MNRTDQHKLNNEVHSFLSSLEKGQICVGIVIQWLQDNLSSKDWLKPSIIDTNSENKVEEIQFYARLWIYSHHIYSKVKRREILDLAHEFHLTGFCLPGKPGMICVEGVLADCDEWWQKVSFMQ